MNDSDHDSGARRGTGWGNVLSGLAGGALVGIVFAVAIAAGWIEAENGGSATAPPATLSVSDGDRDGDGDALSAAEIYERSADSVAFVEATGAADPGETFPFGDPGGAPQSSGTGFLIDDDGHVLTNAHVVQNADSVEVTLGDRDPVDAEIVGSDASTDIAVLRVDAADTTPLQLGESAGVQVGDTVVAIGNPFGLDRTVTTGIVSALQREITAPNGFTIRNVVQTDAAINPGNSGGPLLDVRGRVIGINSQIATGGGRGNVGIGFAVPADTAQRVAEELIAEGAVERSFMGITGADLDAETAEQAGIDAEQGAIVAEVTEGGPADRAGIEGADPRTGEPRDVIVAIDGQEMATMGDVIAFIDEADPGQEVEVELVRGDERRTVELRLGTRPADDRQSG